MPDEIYVAINKSKNRVENRHKPRLLVMIVLLYFSALINYNKVILK